MKKIHTPSDNRRATLHGVVAFEGVTVAGEDSPTGRAAVIPLEGIVQPGVDAGEGLPYEHIPEELLRQLQGVGAAEAQNGLRLTVHLKGHVKRAVNTGNGIVCVGTGFADHIIVAAGGSGNIHGGSLSHGFRGEQRYSRKNTHRINKYSGNRRKGQGILWRGEGR